MLGLLLFTSVLGANLAVGADRTVLDADFVKDGMNEEGVPEEFAANMVSEMKSEDGEEPAAFGLADSSAPNPDDVADSVVTAEYARGELERNVDSLYAYLHGERDELVLQFDLRPVKEGFADEYETWVLEADVEELEPDTDGEGADYSMADLAESEESFHETRETFREDQYERIQEETPRHRTQSELEQLYDDYRDDIRDEMVSRLESQIGDEVGPPKLQEAAVAYGTVGIDALVAEEMTYEEYMDNEAAARENLADAASSVVRDTMDDEVPDTMDMTEEMDEGAKDSFETMRSGVSLLSILTLVLPVGAVASAGLLGYVTRRRSTGLWRVGGVVAVAGLVGVAAGVVLSAVLSNVLEPDGEEPSAMGDAMVTIVTDALGTIAVQSVAVLVLGLAIVGAGYAIRRGIGPVADYPTGADEDEE